MKPLSILFIILSFAAFSCGDTSLTRTLPNVSGAAGEVLVVADKILWDGEPGETIRDILSGPINTLPRPEPAFDLIHIAPEALQDRFMLYRTHCLQELLLSWALYMPQRIRSASY